MVASMCSSDQSSPTAGMRVPPFLINVTVVASNSRPAMAGASSVPSSVHPVTLRADALEGLLADNLAGRRVRCEEASELRVADRLHRRSHGGVLGAAELGATAGERPRSLRPEPRVVRAARDGVDLAAESWDPPAVDDVRGDDLEVHDPVHGHHEVVDGDLTAGIAVEPVVLVPLDLDLEAAGRPRRRRVLDLGQLHEDEGDDDREQQHRDDRPGNLDSRVASHLRAFGSALPVAPAIADDEEEQRRLDENEDEARHEEDEDVRVVDRLRVLRRGLDRRQAAVLRQRGGSEGERCERGDEGGQAHEPDSMIEEMSERSRVVLPPAAGASFEVYVNGVRQQEGTDFTREGGVLVFPAHSEAGGTPWSLAVVVADARRRGDLPPERLRGRDLHCRRPAARRQPLADHHRRPSG